MVFTGGGRALHRGRPTHATKIGWMNPTLYSLFKSTGYGSDYTPCTSGTNGAYSCQRHAVQSDRGYRSAEGLALAKRPLVSIAPPR